MTYPPFGEGDQGPGCYWLYAPRMKVSRLQILPFANGIGVLKHLFDKSFHIRTSRWISSLIQRLHEISRYASRH
jgi:hypothetical protein